MAASRMTPKPDTYTDSETLSFELDTPAPPALVAVASGPDRAAILRQVAQALAEASSADEMLHTLFEDTKDAFRIDAYFNFMINERGDALTLASHDGIAYEDACMIERLEFGRGICGNVALKRAPIVMTDVQSSDDPRVQLVKGYGIRTYACFPLMSGEHLLGTLAFASRTRERFGETDLDLLREISRQVALAYVRLRRGRHRRESDRKTHEFLTTLMQELRNPQAPLLAALDVVRQKGTADPDLQSACSVIEEQLQSKMQFLTDLLEAPQVAEEPPALAAIEDVTFTYTPG
jgi:GAF domain-containing protein